MQAQGICAAAVNPVTSCRNTLTFKLISCCKTGTKLTATHSHRTCSAPVETQVSGQSSVISVPEKRLRKHSCLVLISAPPAALLAPLAIPRSDEPPATLGASAQPAPARRAVPSVRPALHSNERAWGASLPLTHQLTPAIAYQRRHRVGDQLLHLT